MKFRRTAPPVLLAVILLSAAFASISHAKPAQSKPPVPGAVHLPASQVVTVGAVNCGAIGSEWLPGTSLKKGWFVTHTLYAQYYAKLAKKAKGKQARRYDSLAAQYKKKAKSQ